MTQPPSKFTAVRLDSPKARNLHALKNRRTAACGQSLRYGIATELDMTMDEFVKADESCGRCVNMIRRQISAREKHTWQVLEHVMDKLSPELREVFLLAEVEGMTHEDIARAISVRRNVVSTRLLRARRLIQEATKKTPGV